MSAYERVLDALVERVSAVRTRGDRQASAQCPAHPDRNPSLSVTRGSDRVLIKCQAGCDKSDVIAALGFTLADLFDEPMTKGADAEDDDWMPCRANGCRAVKTAEYPYYDEQGTMLYAVTRCAAKHLRPWRPDASARGGRRWNLDGVRRVPYRLPQLIDAVAADRVVGICEGEKDADALAARVGMTATTNPFGAANWPAEFSAYLRGADVDVYADRDPAGRRRAEQIVATLRGVARSVAVAQARFGKDVADHFAAGGHTGNFITVWEPVPYPGGTT